MLLDIWYSPLFHIKIYKTNMIKIRLNKIKYDKICSGKVKQSVFVSVVSSVV
jgi:hypothetical protein